MNEEELINSALLHRSFTFAPKVIERAEGSYIYIKNEKVLDGCGGAAVMSVGHCNPKVIQELTEQLNTVSYIHTLDCTTDAAEDFANKLLSGYEDVLAKAYVVNSGSEATEAAIKLATQYFYEQGMTSKTEIISRHQSYHGNCLGGLSLSGHVARTTPYKGILSPHMHKVDPAFEYRYKHATESREEYVSRLARELEEKILAIGPKKVAAFFAETIVGATSGCVVAPDGYFKAIREVCDKYDVLLVLDEIMCGSGRTGTFFAWEQEGVVPDITTCGKAISSGYSPLSVCIFNHKVANVIKNGSGSFNNGHTFQAYPLSCRAGLAVQKIVREDNLLHNVKVMGEYLSATLKKELSSFKIVGDIRGRGLFWAIEIVKDKTTKQPFPPELQLGLKLRQLIWEHGVAVYPGTGTIDGTSGDHILLAPMFIVNKSEIDIIVSAIRKALGEIDPSR